MALACGWKPGMTEDKAIEICNAFDSIGYSMGNSIILEFATEREIKGLLGQAVKELDGSSEVK